MENEKWFVIGRIENGVLVYSNSEDGMVYTKDEAYEEFNKIGGYAQIREYEAYNAAFKFGEIIEEKNKFNDLEKRVFTVSFSMDVVAVDEADAEEQAKDYLERHSPSIILDIQDKAEIKETDGLNF